jgi:hypothetical protein
VIPRAFRMTFVLFLTLCFAFAGILPSQDVLAKSCCTQPAMLRSQNGIGMEEGRDSEGCCCGSKATQCSVSEGCTFGLPDSSVLDFARAQNLALSDIAPGGINGLPELVSHNGLLNKFHLPTLGLPAPLFLLKASLLC